MMTIEKKILWNAAKRRGWVLFRPKTAVRLASKGWVEPAKHPVFGDVHRMTEAGVSALKSVTVGRLPCAVRS